MKKIVFFQKSHPLFCTSFNPCIGLPRGYQLSLYPKKGGPASFITPGGCIALVYSEPYENIILKKEPNRNSALPSADFP